MNMKPNISRADLIRAVLDGKVVQYQHPTSGGWQDMGAQDAILELAAPAYGTEFRLKPESIESWHPVFSNGFVDQGFASRAEAVAVSCLQKDFRKLLRLELDPDTLDVIDARTEAP